MKTFYVTFLLIGLSLSSCLPSETLRKLGMTPASPHSIESDSLKSTLTQFMTTCTKFYKENGLKVCVDRASLKSMLDRKSELFAEKFEADQFFVMASLNSMIEEYFAANKEISTKGTYNGKSVNGVTANAFSKTNDFIEDYNVSPQNVAKEIHACSEARQINTFGLYCLLSSDRASDFVSGTSSFNSNNSQINDGTKTVLDDHHTDNVSPGIHGTTRGSDTQTSDLDEFNDALDQAEQDSKDDNATPAKDNTTSDLDEFNNALDQAEQGSKDDNTTPTKDDTVTPTKDDSTTPTTDNTVTPATNDGTSDLDDFNAAMEAAEQDSKDNTITPTTTDGSSSDLDDFNAALEAAEQDSKDDTVTPTIDNGTSDLNDFNAAMEAAEQDSKDDTDTPSTNDGTSNLDDFNAAMEAAEQDSKDDSVAPTTDESASDLDDFNAALEAAEQDSKDNTVKPSTTDSSTSDLDDFNAAMEAAQQDSTDNTVQPTTTDGSSDLDDFNAAMEAAQQDSTDNTITPSTNDGLSDLDDFNAAMEAAQQDSTDNTVTPSTNDGTSDLDDFNAAMEAAQQDSTDNTITPSTTDGSASDLDDFNAMLEQAENNTNGTSTSDTSGSDSGMSDLDAFNAMLEQSQLENSRRLFGRGLETSNSCPGGLNVFINEMSSNAVVGQCINSIKSLCLFAHVSRSLALAKGKKSNSSLISKCNQELMKCTSKVPDSTGGFIRSNNCSNKLKSFVFKHFMGGYLHNNFDTDLTNEFRVQGGITSIRRKEFYLSLIHI